MTVSATSLSSRSLSLDHQSLSQALGERENILIIQDLDGVCMGLVKDPLTRTMEPRYIKAAKALGQHFFVLTNGEHIGQRGVNGIIERTFDPDTAQSEGLYLQGLAGGGVQWQDSYGNTVHPGVSTAEMTFLEAVPVKVAAYLRELSQELSFGLSDEQLEEYIQATVLDNKVSPTANLNVFHETFSDRPQLYAQLQQKMQEFSEGLLKEAQQQDLGDSFFIHYAPNLGRDATGKEIVQPAQGQDSGTTDFQFMLRGAIKEVGVLVILNHYYYLQTGKYPLGMNFNAREAPNQPAALLQLARDNFDPHLMPTIVGVGDTVTSKAVEVNGKTEYKRGGSDRGFLELVQALGREFQTDNGVIYVDSSGGELKNRQALKIDRSNPDKPSVLQSIGDGGDTEDPLTLNFVFPNGHQEYIDLFCSVAAARSK
ncbi:MAG: glucosylglycerol 3-phosphatase [Cyanobacteria bacterium J06623_7]